jgi:hypothetical protein
MWAYVGLQETITEISSYTICQSCGSQNRCEGTVLACGALAMRGVLRGHTAWPPRTQNLHLPDIYLWEHQKHLCLHFLLTMKGQFKIALQMPACLRALNLSEDILSTYYKYIGTNSSVVG